MSDKVNNSRGGQRRIIANLSRLVRIAIGNRSIQVATLILTLIATVATREVRILVGLEKTQENESDVNDSRPSYAPFEYTLNEHQPLFIQDARTSLSVTFQNFVGEEFVSLNISPVGKKSLTHAVLRGKTKQFESSIGIFNVQILDIDYDNRKVVLQVSRALQQK